MLKKKYILFPFICLFISTFSNCNSTDNRVELPSSENISKATTIELTHIRDFYIEPTSEVTIDRVYDIASFNQQGNKIAWINSDKNQVFVTNTKGDHLFNFGSSGRGPEEFLEVFSVGFDSDDNVIVYDAKLDSFKKFNSLGLLVDTYDGIRDHGIFTYTRKLHFNDDFLFISAMEMEKANEKNFWKSKTVAKLNLKFELIGLMGQYDPGLTGTTFLYKYPMVTFDPENEKIYTNHRTLPFTQVFSINNSRNLGRFGLNSSSFKNAEDAALRSDPTHIRRQKNLNQSFVEESFVSGDYYFLQHSTYSEDVITYSDTFLRESYLNVFEKNPPYRFLGEIKLGSIPVHITNENQVYLLKDNNPDNFTVEVYDLVIDI